jgi:hypothetical protein
VKRLWPLLAVLAIALAGCQLGHEARADLPTQEFILNGGQEAAVSGENLRLRFIEVLEDSRCPTQVDCVWSGRARIAVLVQPAGHPPSTVEFTTSPGPTQNDATAEVDGYTIGLKSLDPYPQTTAPIPFEEYRATLSVRTTAP